MVYSGALSVQKPFSSLFLLYIVFNTKCTLSLQDCGGNALARPEEECFIISLLPALLLSCTLYLQCTIGLQWYTGVPVHCDIFCHDTNIVYWTSYHDIYDTFTYASTNMGKHYLRLDSPYAWRFSKLTRKIHAEIGLSAVQTSEPTSKTRGNTLLVLLLCNILYHVSHHDNCIVQKCIVAGLQYYVKLHSRFGFEIFL